MATSGSYDFSMNRNDIIKHALRKLGIPAQGQDLEPKQIQDAAESLEMITKAQNIGVRLWSRTWETKVFTASDEVTGSDGSVYTCMKSHTSAADNKPVTGGDYSSYWTRRGSTGGTWVTSTSYSSSGDFTLDPTVIDIDKAFIRDGAGGGDTPVNIVPLPQYMELGTKDSLGQPHTLAIAQFRVPEVYLYPQPDNTNYVLHYLQVRHLQNAGAQNNDPDFPVNWLWGLVYELAVDLAPEYGVGGSRIRVLEAKRARLMASAHGQDSESFNEMRIEVVRG